MRLFTYLVKSLNVLNLLLVAAVLVLALYVLFPLMNKNVAYQPPAVKAEPSVVQEESNTNQSPAASDYIVVAEQNVFHPDRKIPPEGKDEKALPKPEILLYGTVLTDTMRIAYIEDKKSPQTTPGRGNRQVVLKQGDQVSGFILRDVEKDRIVLVKGEEQMVVYLSDAKKTRTQVAPTQGAGAAGRPPASPGPQPAMMPTMLPGAGAAAPAASPMQVAPSTPAAATPVQPMRQPSRPPRTSPAQAQSTP